jgi:Flp pilus assembly protein TadD
MRQLKKSLLTLCLASSTLLAQMNPHEPLHQVLFFVQQGQFGKALDVAKPLIDSHEVSGVDLGRARLMLGVAYGGDGKFAEARNAFERSLHILGHDHEHVTDHAAALHN